VFCYVAVHQIFIVNELMQILCTKKSNHFFARRDLQAVFQQKIIILIPFQSFYLHMFSVCVSGWMLVMITLKK
jgi:hypothetical protein